MAKQSKYPEPKRVKVGRIKYVCDFDGKPLVGLSWDRANGQYFFTHFKQEKDFIAGRKTRKDYSFGSDYSTAVFGFKQWREQAGKLTLSLPQGAEVEQWLTATLSPDDVAEVQEALEERGITDYPVDAVHRFRYQAPDLSAYNIESKIKADRKYALHLARQLLADEEIKIEVIRMLQLNELLPKQYKPLPLKDILDFYCDRAEEECSNKEKKQVALSVEDFIHITGRKLINDITEDDIELFRDAVKATRQSDTYKAGRLNKFKTCLNYYVKWKRTNGEKELVRQVHTWCVEKFNVSTPDADEYPHRMDTALVAKIMEKAKDDRELFTMFLLMLNTGYYPVDVRGLQKSMIMETDGVAHINHRRSKTKGRYIRVNCLWPLTVKLLQEQCERTMGEFVFTTDAKGPYAESTLGKRFTAFFEGLTHKDGTQVSAKHFRDTVGSSLAFKVPNTNILKVTLGHTVSNKKQETFWKYVEACPQEQQPAADILWERFSSVIPETSQDAPQALKTKIGGNDTPSK